MMTHSNFISAATDKIAKTPRGQILLAIASEGLLIVDDLVEKTTLNAKQIRDNAGAARAEGLLTSRRDEVTGGVGYQITITGRDWLKSRGIDPMQKEKLQADRTESEPEDEAEPASVFQQADQEPAAESLADTETPDQPDEKIVRFDGPIWAILDLSEVLAIDGDETHAREITRRHCLETGEPAMLFRLTPICKASSLVVMNDL